jgi:uncharacterized protein DUF2380
MPHRALGLVAILSFFPLGLTAQTAAAGPEAPTAPVAVLSTALYNDQANVREAGDSAPARVGGTVLRARLADSFPGQLLDPRITDSLERTPAMRRLGAGVACNVKVACALAVGRAQGARWVVMSKVSKTSNLIWLLSAQLVRVEDGSIVLDDSTELKGEPGRMVEVGMRQFADRVRRTVRAGGVATNFPNGEPTLSP